MSYAPFQRASSRNSNESQSGLEDSELEMQRRNASSRLPGYDNSSDTEITYRPRHRARRRSYPFIALVRLPELFSRPRTALGLLKWIIPLFSLIVIVFFFMWELHIEIMWYSRHWVEKEIKTLQPLGGCFDPQRVSSAYNLTTARGPKRTEVQTGLPLRFGMDCYDFAATIQLDASAPRMVDVTLFHTYWRVDLAPFEARQEWMIKSFFATQDVKFTKLILWSNGDLSGNPVLRTWRERYPDAFELRIVDIETLAHGTALEGSRLLRSSDTKAWVDGDLIRLLLLWNYGGVWIDMDSLLTRDLSPLLEHEFVTQWDCYDKKYSPFNGALMHFLKHSPYLCEFFYLMETSPPPHAGSTDWGSLLYLKLWRRLVAGGIPPFKVLPFCFSDARSCQMDNRLPDPFVPDGRTWADGLSLKGEGSPLQSALGKVFSVHLHNQWEKAFPPGGWVDRYLLSKYDRILT